MPDPIAAPPDAALAALQELPLPQPVSYMPQTAGWWIVGGILLLLVLWIMWRGHKRHLANRYRVEALAELERIELEIAQTPQRALAATRLPALIKRVALCSAPRADVASLSGKEWLAWLDRSLPQAGFLDAPGWLLPQLAYGVAPNADAHELHALLALTRRWIRDHHVRV